MMIVIINYCNNYCFVILSVCSTGAAGLQGNQHFFFQTKQKATFLPSYDKMTNVKLKRMIPLCAGEQGPRGFSGEPGPKGL